MCIKSSNIQSTATLGCDAWCHTQDSVAQLESHEGSVLQTCVGLEQRLVAVHNPFIQPHNVKGNHKLEFCNRSQFENVKQSGPILSKLLSPTSTSMGRPHLIPLANTSFSEFPVHPPSSPSSPSGGHMPKRWFYSPTAIHGDCYPLEIDHEPAFRHQSPVDRIMISNVQSSTSQLCASTCEAYGELDNRAVFKAFVQFDEGGRYPEYQSKTIVFPPSREHSKPVGCKVPAVSMPTFVPTITAHMVQPLESLDEVSW